MSSLGRQAITWLPSLPARATALALLCAGLALGCTPDPDGYVAALSSALAAT